MRQLISVAIGCVLSVAISLFPIAPAASISPADVPNPRQVNGGWVLDMAELLSDETEAELNRMVSALEADNGSELTVVTVTDTASSSSPKAFATELFNIWGIGKKEHNNGVLFLVSTGDRHAVIETGYGIEDLISDAQAQSILDTKVVPYFKRNGKSNRFEVGIVDGTQAIVAALKGDAASVAAPTLLDQVMTPFRAVEYWLFGILFNTFALSMGTGAAVLAVLIRKSSKQRTVPITIAPVGRSCLTSDQRFWSLSYWIHYLSNQRSSLEKDLCYSALSLKNSRDKSQPLTRDSLLVFHRWNEYVRASLKPLVIALVVMSGVLTVMLRFQVLGAIGLAAVWLAWELWCSGRWLHAMSTDETGADDADTENETKNGSQLLVQSLGQVLLLSFLLAFFLIVVALFTGGVGFLLLPFVPITVLGGYAALLRLVRSRPGDDAVHCRVCEEPMLRLPLGKLKLQLSKAERVEMRLGTRVYEAWHCANCEPFDKKGHSQAHDSQTHDSQADGGLSQTRPQMNLHLFSCQLSLMSMTECEDCGALAVEQSYKTEKMATTLSAGLGKVVQSCHCCGATSEEEFVRPKRSPKKQNHSGRARNSSSDGYTSYSGGDSGGGYSGGDSGGSYSGGDGGSNFGGGESGGGGADAGW